MNSPRIRIQIAALLFIMLPAVAGVVAVNASATCERFVRTYVTKPVRNRVSRTTAEAWAAWRIAHPNWKPNPKLHRPKYVMNRDEAVQKVEFACSVPLIPAAVDGLLAEAPPIVIFPPMEATQITLPNEIPPEVAELTPQDQWPPLAPWIPVIVGSPPVLPIVPPPVVGPVPEPTSLLLAGTGIAGVCLCLLVGRLRTAENREISHTG